MSFYVLHLTVSRSDIRNVTLIHMYANTLIFVTIHTSRHSTPLISMTLKGVLNYYLPYTP
jgi:hypothetical protein